MVFSHGHKEAGLDAVFLKKGKQNRDTLFHTFIGVHMDCNTNCLIAAITGLY